MYEARKLVRVELGERANEQGRANKRAHTKKKKWGCYSSTITCFRCSMFTVRRRRGGGGGGGNGCDCVPLSRSLSCQGKKKENYELQYTILHTIVLFLSHVR